MSRFDDSVSYFSDLKNKNYRKSELIGQGAYGNVYSVSDDSGEERALKQIAKNKYGIACMLECIIMNSITHPGLQQATETFCTEGNVNLIQEKAISDLTTKTRKKIFNLALVRKWLYKISQAVLCLHKHDIIHADIKASNVLYFSDEDVRLTDFSLSAKILKENDEFTQPACTYSHCPPETLLCQKWNKSLDIWSLGCTFYEVAFGHSLFPHQEKLDDIQELKSTYYDSVVFWIKNIKDNPEEIAVNVGKNYPGEVPKRINYPKESTVLATHEYSLLKDLIYKMLVYDKEKRLTIKQVLSHSFFPRLKPVDMEIKYTPKYPLIRNEMDYISEIVFGVLKKFKTLSVETMTLLHSISISIFLKCLPMQKIKNIRPEDLVIGCIWIAIKIGGLRIKKLDTDLNLEQIVKLESEICVFLSFCIPTIVDGENI